ncbi:hypothetical protein VIGAN_11043100, partial [Vigna angularis var. angularis]
FTPAVKKIELSITAKMRKSLKTKKRKTRSFSVNPLGVPKMEERGGTRVGTEKMLLNRRVEENLVGEKGFKSMRL